MITTDTIGAVLTTTTGGRRNHLGSLIGNPGMAVVSRSVCILSLFLILVLPSVQGQGFSILSS